MCQCARVRSILGEGAGWLGAGRCHDSDACRLGAGADSAEGRTRAACGAPGRAKHFKFGSGREVAREPGCGSAGRPEPAREGRVRGTVRGLTFWAGNAAAPAPPARKRRCGIARGRTSFASTDGQPRGWRCSGGRAGRRAGNEAAGGGPHCLALPAGRLGASSAGGRGKGWPVVCARPFPREFQVGRGAARSRALQRGCGSPLGPGGLARTAGREEAKEGGR